MIRIPMILVGLTVVFACNLGEANNNHYLPGDAFFYAEPNHEWFENLMNTEQPIVNYRRSRIGGGKFCGFAGYDQLRLENLTPEMRANLINAYRQLRGRYPQQVSVFEEQRLKMVNGKLVPDGEQAINRHEHNLVTMLIYNREFDTSRFRPLLRYNENWAEVAAAFGHRRDRVGADFFVDDNKSIVSDWRDSTLVAPLKIKGAEVDPKTGQFKNGIISVDCQDIQILLFPTTFYEDMAYPEESVSYQSVSMNRRSELPNSSSAGGGMFAIQDSVEDEDTEENEGLDEDAESEKVPYFAYRATASGVEILKPQNGHWVVKEELVPLSLKPVHRFEQEWWKNRLASKREAAKNSKDSRVLLIGDSITHGWESHTGIWDQMFPMHKAFNIGFSGDRTEHVLWRLQNGAADELNPEFVVLMIGTNNTGQRLDPPADIANGIQAIIDDLRVRIPEY